MVSHVFLHVPDDELRAYRYISIGGYHPYSARHMSYIKLSTIQLLTYLSFLSLGYL